MMKSTESRVHGTDALPANWEQAHDYQGGPYYMDHVNSKYFDSIEENFAQYGFLESECI